MIKRSSHKFNAVKTEIDGHVFASKAEARRYGELKMLEKAGEVHGLLLQPRYELSIELQRKAVINRQRGCEEAARQQEALARSLLHLPPSLPVPDQLEMSL